MLAPDSQMTSKDDPSALAPRARKLQGAGGEPPAQWGAASPTCPQTDSELWVLHPLHSVAAAHGSWFPRTRVPCAWPGRGPRGPRVSVSDTVRTASPRGSSVLLRVIPLTLSICKWAFWI